MIQDCGTALMEQSGGIYCSPLTLLEKGKRDKCSSCLPVLALMSKPQNHMKIIFLNRFGRINFGITFDKHSKREKNRTIASCGYHNNFTYTSCVQFLKCLVHIPRNALIHPQVFSFFFFSLFSKSLLLKTANRHRRYDNKDHQA